LWNWLAARKAARNCRRSIKSSVFNQRWVRALEDRCFLSVGCAARGSRFTAGQSRAMTFKLDQKLDPKRVAASRQGVGRRRAGADQAINQRDIRYAAKSRTITINGQTSADTVFKVKLLSRSSRATTRACGLMRISKSAGKERQWPGRWGIILPMTQTTAAGPDPVWRDSPRLWATWMCNSSATVKSRCLPQNQADPPITVAKFPSICQRG